MTALRHIELVEGISVPPPGLLKRVEFDQYREIHDLAEAARSLGLAQAQQQIAEERKTIAEAAEAAHVQGLAQFVEAAAQLQQATLEVRAQAQQMVRDCLLQVFVGCDVADHMKAILGPTLLQLEASALVTFEVAAETADAFEAALAEYLADHNIVLRYTVEPSAELGPNGCIIYTEQSIIEFNHNAVADRLLKGISTGQTAS